MTRRHLAGLAAYVTAALVLLGGASLLAPSHAPARPAAAVATSTPDALTLAQDLPVSDADVPGYVRDQFGSGWLDTDHNGCSSRDDVLKRDATNPVMSSPCHVATGTFVDPYDATTYTGTTTALDIDHGVALADAWRSGASLWTKAQREALANDLANLVPTSAHTNRAKGDLGPDQWMPVDHASACAYAARYVRVKAAYHLTVTTAQKAALVNLLTVCPCGTR